MNKKDKVRGLDGQSAIPGKRQRRPKDLVADESPRSVVPDDFDR